SPAGERLIARISDDLTFIVDSYGQAKNVWRKSAEAPRDAVLPEEGDNSCAVCRERNTDYLTSIVDVQRVEQQSSERPQVNRRAIVPEHGMKSTCTIARLADDVALIVNRVGDTVRVTGKRGERSHLALLPDDRLKLGHLGVAYAGCV